MENQSFPSYGESGTSFLQELNNEDPGELSLFQNNQQPQTLPPQQNSLEYPSYSASPSTSYSTSFVQQSGHAQSMPVPFYPSNSQYPVSQYSTGNPVASHNNVSLFHNSTSSQPMLNWPHYGQKQMHQNFMPQSNSSVNQDGNWNIHPQSNFPANSVYSQNSLTQQQPLTTKTPPNADYSHHLQIANARSRSQSSYMPPSQSFLHHNSFNSGSQNNNTESTTQALASSQAIQCSYPPLSAFSDQNFSKNIVSQPPSLSPVPQKSFSHEHDSRTIQIKQYEDKLRMIYQSQNQSPSIQKEIVEIQECLRSLRAVRESEILRHRGNIPPQAYNQSNSPHANIITSQHLICDSNYQNDSLSKNPPSAPTANFDTTIPGTFMHGKSAYSATDGSDLVVVSSNSILPNANSSSVQSDSSSKSHLNSENSALKTASLINNNINENHPSSDGNASCSLAMASSNDDLSKSTNENKNSEIFKTGNNDHPALSQNTSDSKLSENNTPDNCHYPKPTSAFTNPASSLSPNHFPSNVPNTISQSHPHQSMHFNQSGQQIPSAYQYQMTNMMSNQRSQFNQHHMQHMYARGMQRPSMTSSQPGMPSVYFDNMPHSSNYAGHYSSMPPNRMPGHPQMQPMQVNPSGQPYPSQQHHAQMMSNQSRQYQSIAPAPHPGYAGPPMQRPVHPGYPNMLVKEHCPPGHQVNSLSGNQSVVMENNDMVPGYICPNNTVPSSASTSQYGPTNNMPQVSIAQATTSTPVKPKKKKKPSSGSADTVMDGNNQGTVEMSEEKPKKKRQYKKRKKPEGDTSESQSTVGGTPNISLPDGTTSVDLANTTGVEPPTKKKKATTRKRATPKKDKTKESIAASDSRIVGPGQPNDPSGDYGSVMETSLNDTAETIAATDGNYAELNGAQQMTSTPIVKKKKVVKPRFKVKKKKPLPTLIKKKRNSRRGFDSDSDHEIHTKKSERDGDHESANVIAKRRSERVSNRKKYSDMDLGLLSEDEQDMDDDGIATMQENQENENEIPVRTVEKILGTRMGKRIVQQIDENNPDQDKENTPEEEEEVEEFYVKYKGFSYLHCEWKPVDEIEDPRIISKIKRYQTKKKKESNALEEDEDLFNPDYVEVDRVLDMKIFLNDEEITHGIEKKKEKPVRKFTTGARLDTLLDEIELGPSNDSSSAPQIETTNKDNIKKDEDNTEHSNEKRKDDDTIVVDNSDIQTIQEIPLAVEEDSSKQDDRQIEAEKTSIEPAIIELTPPQCEQEKTSGIELSDVMDNSPDKLETLNPASIKPVGSPIGSNNEKETGSDEKSICPDVEFTRAPSPVEVTYYLVKWRGLAYEDSTWELAQDVDPNKVKEYLRLRELPDEEMDFTPRPKAEDWKKIDEHRVYKNGNHLRDYQLEGINWLSFCYFNHRNCILADEMGLGKTVQSITFLMEAVNVGIRGPFLVIVPLSTIGNWQREFENWSDMNVIVYHGSSTSRSMLQEYEIFYRDKKGQKVPNIQKFQALITTYEVLMTDIEFIGQFEWRICIIDEAHRLKNKNCKLGEGLRYLELEHRVLLTGTPLQNNVEELFSLLNFLEPAKFASSEQFLAEFGDLKTEEQVDNLKAILKPMMLRRLKEDVEKSLAPKEETIIEVELTNVQKQYYRAIMERNFTFLCKGTSGSNMPNLMNMMMELRKCCNHPFLIKGAEDNIVDEMRNKSGHEWSLLKDSEFTHELMDKLNFHSLVNASGKLVLVHKLLPKLKANGHKVLVFSQMVRVLDILEDYLVSQRYPYERIDGRIHGLLRQEAIDRFSTDPNKFVFLLCTKAGGLGINLTAADVVIIYDSDWNPQNDLQAQARCHRIGQVKMVNVYRLITRNTYEREMFDRASLKLGLDKAVLQSINSKDTNLSQMSKKEIEDLLKKGAYAAVMDDDNAGEDFCEADIDQILKQRATVVQLGSEEKNSTFSKATFSMSDNRNDIEVDDPNFWQKWAKKAGVDEVIVENDKSLILGERRQRRQTTRYSTAQASFHVSDDESSRSSDDDDNPGAPSKRSNKKSKNKNRRTQKEHYDPSSRPPQPKRRSGEPLDRVDLFKIEKCLLLWGWGRFKEAIARVNFKRSISPDELETVSRAMLIYALRHYKGDVRIKNFIFDLVRPDSDAACMRKHCGLSAPVARGRRGRRLRGKPGEDDPPPKEEPPSPGKDIVDLEGDIDVDRVIASDSFKRHLERASNKLLHRIQTLYFLYHEVIGLERAANLIAGQDHTQIEPSLVTVLQVPTLTSPVDLPIYWWNAIADSCFLMGVYKHGFEKYSAIRADPKLCFLEMCGPPDGNIYLDAERAEDLEMEEDSLLDLEMRGSMTCKSGYFGKTEADTKTEHNNDDKVGVLLGTDKIECLEVDNKGNVIKCEPEDSQECKTDIKMEAVNIEVDDKPDVNQECDACPNQDSLRCNIDEGKVENITETDTPKEMICAHENNKLNGMEPELEDISCCLNKEEKNTKPSSGMNGVVSIPLNNIVDSISDNEITSYTREIKKGLLVNTESMEPGDVTEDAEKNEGSMKLVDGTEDVEKKKESMKLADGTEDVEKNKESMKPVDGTENAGKNEESMKPVDGTEDVEKKKESMKLADGVEDVEKNKESMKPIDGTEDVEKNKESMKLADGADDIEKNKESMKPVDVTENAGKNEESMKPVDGTEDVEKKKESMKLADGTEDVEKNEELMKPAGETEDAEKSEESMKPIDGTENAEKNEESRKPVDVTEDAEKNEESMKPVDVTEDAEKNEELMKPSDGTEDAEKNEESMKLGDVTENAEKNQESTEDNQNVNNQKNEESLKPVVDNGDHSDAFTNKDIISAELSNLNKADAVAGDIRDNNDTTEQHHLGMKPINDQQREKLLEENIVTLGDVGEEKSFLPFPSITELNSRFRKLIAYFQRLKSTGEIERRRARPIIQLEPIDTDFLIGSHKFDYDVKQLKWSRRESADFYRVVSGYGVEFNKEKNLFNWERFRTLANLTRKSDEALTDYFRAFYSMLRMVCKREPLDDGLPPSMIKIEPISEERASRCLSRIDLLNKIRNDTLPHPQLDKNLEMCKRSSDFPEWWTPGKHDKDLLKGAAKHGLSRTDFYIMNDPDLCFKNIITLIQQRVRSDPDLTKQISIGASSAALSALTASIYADTIEKSANTDTDKPQADEPKDDNHQTKILSDKEDPTLKVDATPDKSTTSSPIPKTESNQGSIDQEEWSLKFATNIAISWPKDRIIQHRLESVCQCIELGHWPSIRRFISLNASAGGSLSETPPIQSPSLLNSSGGAPWSGTAGPFDLGVSQPCTSSSTPSRQISTAPDQATVFSHIDQAMLNVLGGSGGCSLQPPAVPLITPHRGGAHTVGRAGRPRGRRKGLNSGALHTDIPYRRFNSGLQSDDAESLTSLDNDTRTGTPLLESSVRTSINSGNPLGEIMAAAVAANVAATAGVSTTTAPHSSSISISSEATNTIPDLASSANPRKRKIDSLADRLLNAAAAESGKKEKLEGSAIPSVSDSASITTKSLPEQPIEIDESLWKVRVPVISLRDSSLVYGDEAPLRRDLEKWLTDHPDYMPYSVEKADQEIYGRVAKLRGQDTSAMEALAYSHYLSMLQASSSSSSTAFSASTSSSHAVNNSYLQQASNYSAHSITSKDKPPSIKEERKPSVGGGFHRNDEKEADLSISSKSSMSPIQGSRSRGRGRGRPPNSTIRDSLANQRSAKRSSTMSNNSVNNHLTNAAAASISASNALNNSNTVQQQQAALAAALVSAATGNANQMENPQLAAANLEAMMAAYQAYMYNPLMYTQLMAAQSAGYSNYLAAAAAAAAVTQQQQQLFSEVGEENISGDKTNVGDSPGAANNVTSSNTTPLSRQIHSRGAKTASALAVAAVGGSASKKVNHNSEASNKNLSNDSNPFLKDYSSLFGLSKTDASSLTASVSNSSNMDMSKLTLESKHSKAQNINNLSSKFDLNHKSDAESMQMNDSVDTDDCVLDLSKKS